MNAYQKKKALSLFSENRLVFKRLGISGRLWGGFD